MSELTFDQLLAATRLLGPEQRQVLAQTLHLCSCQPQTNDSFTQVEVLNEAGAFSVFAPLHDAHPAQAAITDAELVAAAQCISCEWEEEPL